MRLHPLVLALGLTPLVGCGGSSSNSTPDPTPEIPASYSVRAVDGYLRNAQVWLDINGNFQLDDSEPNALSGEGGIAVLDTTNINNPEQYSVVVKAIAAQTIDEDSITDANPEGIATTTPFLLSAPAGQTIITPLSTLVNIKMKNGLEQSQAVTEVAEDLGIPESSLLGDYIAEENGDIAAKANAIVELNVLPESELQMQEMNQDNSNLDAQLATNLQIIQSLTEEQRLVKEEDGTVIVATNVDTDDDGVIDEKDAFPSDVSEWLDSDNDGTGDNGDAFPTDAAEKVDTDKDGTGDNSDAFPEDATETVDTDKDGTGDNGDAFPEDAAETVDTDKDGTGDNSDTFPEDATETVDTDKDGFGDNADAYKDDPEKSVLDITTTKTTTTLFTQQAFQNVTVVEVQEENTIATFNNGDIQTTTEVTYTTTDGTPYGNESKSDLLKADGSFSRINEWSYDFNLDGNSQFVGQALAIGNRTASGETFLNYIDESDAALEGGDNGGGRVFDNMDLSSRNHPDDLSLVDTIQNNTVSWQQDTTTKTIDTDYQQYSIVDFDRSALASLIAEYAYHSNQVIGENGVYSYSDLRDWNADGSINQSIQFAVNSTDSYTFSVQRPIWADPTDGMDEEYADYNFAAGKADTLTSYWYETSESLNDQGVRESAGKRYVLDMENEANVKLVNADNPDGLLFQEYRSTRKSVSDIESNEAVSWTHYPLSDYDFTVDVKDPGQAYKVFQKQSNGIWVGYSFPEWGTQSIVDLAGQIEAARSGGAQLSEIDEQVIAGLSRYNLPVTTSSFIYDEQGNARTWYFVSNNSIVTDGQYSISTVTLTDNGFKDGWLVLNGPDNFFLAEPTSDQPWNWFNAYQRYWLGIDSINTASDSFMWGNWLGEFYLNQSQAQARLVELQALSTALIGSWSNGVVSFQFNSDMTYIMEQISSDDGAPDSWAGTESGVYQYAPETGHITVSEIIYDNNGTSGLSDYLHNDSNLFKLESYQLNSSLTFSYIDGDESGEFTLNATTNIVPDKFSAEYLAGKTLYAVWFGDGDLADANGNAIDESGNLITNPDNEIELTDVAVVQEITYNSDGTLTAKGVKNAISMPDGAPYHYIVDTAGILRVVEEQNEATEGNIICDNSHPDYLKTHFVLSDINGVEQFDNVDLFFFDKQKALDYANELNAAIPLCTSAL